MPMAIARGWKIAGGIVLAAVIVFGLLFWRAMQVPKPQIASAAGKAAPDFTLKDQDGHDFTLSSLRGEPVLLLFYRGSW
jgi:cytochrome oxidase Cu insertion factor (SCO1/SenC/PrrC family)